MRPAVNYLGGTIAPSFSAQRANHDDGGDRKTVCSGKHIVAAFLAADHARFRKRQSSHRQYYRGRKGEDQEGKRVDLGLRLGLPGVDRTGPKWVVRAEKSLSVKDTASFKSLVRTDQNCRSLHFATLRSG
jgi:hypothetical protein